MAEHRTQREQLIERELAVEDIAIDEANPSFKVEWRQHLPAQYRLAEIRRTLGHCLDHEIGKLFLFHRVLPRARRRKMRGHVLHE